MKATITTDTSVIFASIFATIANAEELKNTANALSQELIASFKARQAELTGKKAEPTPAPAPKKETPKAEATPAPKAKKAKEEKPKEEPKKTVVKGRKRPDDTIAITDLEAIAKLGLTLTPYTDKSYVLRGEFEPILNALYDQYKGCRNKFLKGGDGVIFSNKRAAVVAEELHIAI